VKPKSTELPVRSQERFLEQARINAARRDPALDETPTQLLRPKPARQSRKGTKVQR
jgi:hypothetical protein